MQHLLYAFGLAMALSRYPCFRFITSIALAKRYPRVLEKASVRTMHADSVLGMPEFHANIDVLQLAYLDGITYNQIGMHQNCLLGWSRQQSQDLGHIPDQRFPSFYELSFHRISSTQYLNPGQSISTSTPTFPIK